MHIRRVMPVLIFLAFVPVAVYPAGDPIPDPKVSESAYDQGRMQAKEGNWDQAVSYFRRAAEENEKSFKALNMLGYSLRQMGNLAEAIEAYDQALVINPNYDQALEYRGVAHLKLGDRKAALRDYRLLIRLGSPLAVNLKEVIDQAAAN